MHESLFRLVNHLSRVVRRMERTGFPPNDTLFKSGTRLDGVCLFCMDLPPLPFVQEWRRKTAQKGQARTAGDGPMKANEMRCELAIIALLLSAGSALAAKPHYEISGEVIKIADGDTLAVLDESKTQHKIPAGGDRRAR